MSLQQENCWDPFLMLEIEAPEILLKKRIHHNDCPYSKVFGELTEDMLRAVYKVTDSSEMGYYYKVIDPIWIRDNNDCITSESLDCYFWYKHGKLAPIEYFTQGEQGKCLCCGKDTSNLYKHKHLCSLRCMAKEQQRFLDSCIVRGMNANAIINLYNSLSNKELQDGIHAYVKEHVPLSSAT